MPGLFCVNKRSGDFDTGFAAYSIPGKYNIWWLSSHVRWRIEATTQNTLSTSSFLTQPPIPPGIWISR